jgi:hypothetical protein
MAHGLLVALSLGSLQACTSAAAVAVGAGRLEQVRLGFGLDREGTVTSGCAASTFARRDPIHLSMQVTNASPGSVVRVAIRDVVTNRIAWSEVRSVPSGHSQQTFEIGREITQGRYLAESTLGRQVTKPWPFVVHDKRQGVR